MQEFIVLLLAVAALAYLVYKFIFKKKSHDCDQCELSDPKNNNNH
mgnify:CR=1